MRRPRAVTGLMVTLSAAILIGLVRIGVAVAPAPPPRQIQIPANLPSGVSASLYSIAVPPGSEPTPAKIKLGEALFNDKRLSADNTIACAHCHEAKLGFVDGETVADGIRGLRGMRNSPTLLNALFNATQFWDGRAASLEEQAKLPILNPVEMGMKSPAEVVSKVKAIPEYVREFREVFGREVTYDDLAGAIAAFERTLYSGNAPFDRYISGNPAAMPESARRGWVLFNSKGRCNTCHAGNAVAPLFSDQKFHNIGIAAHVPNFVTLAAEGLQVVRSGDQKQIDELAIGTKFAELGRFLVTKNESDIGAFKTPTLRNIGITGPYMHDGTLVTLWDVMDHYNKGGVPNPYLDGGMQRLALSEAEIDDLVAFMFALTDDRYKQRAAETLSYQRGLKGKRPQRETEVAMGRKGNRGDVAPNPNLENPVPVGVFGTYVEVKGP